MTENTEACGRKVPKKCCDWTAEHRSGHSERTTIVFSITDCIHYNDVKDLFNEAMRGSVVIYNPPSIGEPSRHPHRAALISPPLRGRLSPKVLGSLSLGSA